MRRFAADPTADSVSMDPSDGGGWCECEACRKIGTPSDRAVRLANEVATSLERRFPDKLVGIYAYNYHSPPPHIEVHPRVVVSVATAFIKGGLKLDDLLTGWSQRGATLGIREYYSVHTWDRDLPGKARGSRIAYLKQTIPDFHRRGARYLSAESSDNWGPNGLGYFLAARMMWDVTEAERTDALIDDFLANCFGAAERPMREFYRQLDGSRAHLVFDDQLGRMFRALGEAREIAKSDPGVSRRLDDLLLYARYVDLFNRYSEAKGPPRQAAFEKLIRHTYRMRETMMVHAKAAYRDIAARDKLVSVPMNAGWNVPEAKNHWKSSDPFTREELDAFLREGIEGRRLVKLDFEPVEFSDDLVPATGLHLREVQAGEVARGRGTQTFYTFAGKAPAKIELQVTGGLIAHYRDRGNVHVQLWKLGGPSQTGEQETLISEDRSAPPDGVKRKVTLALREAGPHRITVSDGGDMTSVAWTPRTRVCWKSSLQEPINTNGRWTLYFYVPKGTRVIGLFGGGPAAIVDPNGRAALKVEDRQANFHSVRVPAGLDGKLWSVSRAAGSIRLLTVPPYLARTGAELLLPREVVQRDGSE